MTTSNRSRDLQKYLNHLHSESISAVVYNQIDSITTTCNSILQQKNWNDASIRPIQTAQRGCWIERDGRVGKTFIIILFEFDLYRKVKYEFFIDIFLA